MLRRDLAVGTQLIDLDGQDAERLADVVVQLTPDAAAFLLLRVNQPAGQLFERLFGPPAFDRSPLAAARWSAGALRSAR